MSRESKIILWLGLIMILVQIVKDWSQIKSSLFGSGGQQGASGKAPFSIIPPIFPWIINPSEGPSGGTPPVENPPPEAPPEAPPPEVPPVEPPPIALGRQAPGGRVVLWPITR